jgi:hypothetical protein
MLMQIVGDMEIAINNCGTGAADAWDRAVALYAGTTDLVCFFLYTIKK